MKETDDSVPYPYGDYEYYTRTVEGLSYGIKCRKRKGSTQEEVVLDVNELAKTVGNLVLFPASWPVPPPIYENNFCYIP